MDELRCEGCGLCTEVCRHGRRGLKRTSRARSGCGAGTGCSRTRSCAWAAATRASW
ncbi:MAG: 4Fe-4S binding protein [Oscillospiraceae bacterium]